MPERLHVGAFAVAAVVAVAAPIAATVAPRLDPVAITDLIVTSGRIDAAGAWLALRAPTVRATVGGAPRRAIEASFVYRGPSADLAPLASGELRRQVGLKLRARDGCNVVYVMWHVAPTTGIHVALKANPGARDHADCGDRGYTTLAPAWTGPGLRPVTAGERHTLAATLVATPAGEELRVDADGAPVWRGPLPAAALTFDGPVGLRSDNGDFDVALRAGPPLSQPRAAR